MCFLQVCSGSVLSVLLSLLHKLRIMSSFPSSTLTEWCQSERSLARCCISSHCQLMELQHASHLQCYQVILTILTLIIIHQEIYHQAFNVDFLKTCAEITKLVIKSTSPLHLQVSLISHNEFFSNKSVMFRMQDQALIGP